MYVCVGDRKTNVCGYAWRIGWGRTSFYIKPRYAALGAVKVSLHGPDIRHPRPGFKVDLDASAISAVRTAEGRFVATEGWLPRWFLGRSVKPGVVHVVRFRWTWDLFGPGLRSAPRPGPVKSRDFAGLVPPPPVGDAIDVDLFVCEKRPYWPNERQARKDRACLGPLRNEAGHYLTGISVKRSVLLHPTPKVALPQQAQVGSNRVRGVGLAVDEHEVLWVREQWMSKRPFGSEDAG